jgi:hypothetical protein
MAGEMKTDDSAGSSKKTDDSAGSSKKTDDSAGSSKKTDDKKDGRLTLEPVQGFTSSTGTIPPGNAVLASRSQGTIPAGNALLADRRWKAKDAQGTSSTEESRKANLEFLLSMDQCFEAHWSRGLLTFEPVRGVAAEDLEAARAKWLAGGCVTLEPVQGFICKTCKGTGLTEPEPEKGDAGTGSGKAHEGKGSGGGMTRSRSRSRSHSHAQ